MTRLENIETLDHPPVVGQQYLVPEAYVDWGPHKDLHPLLAHSRWWPYRGKPHIDPEFKVYEPHIHIEARFLDEQEQEAIWRVYEDREKRGGREPDDRACAPYMIPFDLRVVRGYRLVPRTCLRDDIALGAYTEGSAAALIWGVPKRAHWRRTRDGRCAHHQYNLNTIAPDADGCVTCPLHQLKYDRAGNLVVTGKALEAALVSAGLERLFAKNDGEK